MKLNDAVIGLFLTLLGLVVLWIVKDYPKIPGQQVGPALFPGTPTLFADEHTTFALRDRLAATDALACSVASGSLNDVTKWASSLLGRTYLNVCTAASVDGYTSFGAAITVDGVKGTQECPAPRAVLAPLDIMAAAPVRLTATDARPILPSA